MPEARFLAHDALRALTGPEPSMGGSSRARDYGNWIGASLEETIEMLQRGYLDAVDKINIPPHLSVEPVERPEMLWSETGSDIDISAFLQGVPECMGEMVNQPMPKPLVRIGFDSAASSNVDSNSIAAVGRSVLTAIESLRARGYPTEVWSCVAVYGRSASGIWDGRCLIQSSNAPVHVGKLAFWVAHPAALRRAWFAMMETEPANIRNAYGFHATGSYGRPSPNYARSDFDEWAPSAQHGDREAARWIKELLDRRN